jgi:hypothetical protein
MDRRAVGLGDQFLEGTFHHRQVPQGIRAYDSALSCARARLGEETTMTEDELIEMLRERQNNGRTSYLTFGDLVAMVPSDQIDEWRAVLAKVRAADAARNAEEDAD